MRHSILYSGFDLLIWSAVVNIYPCTTLYWVNTNENMYPNKFSHLQRKYFSHGHWKQIYCLKRQFLWPDRYLFARIQHNINNTIKREICSKLTIEAPERCSSVFIVNFESIRHVVLVFFSWLWTYKCRTEYFIALI